MKKVTGVIDVRALGRHEFEFYVDDDATDEEIKAKVEDECDYFISYDVDEGYIAEQQTVYRKKNIWED